MAFVTGDFSEEGLIDDTTSLTNAQAKSMDNWLKTYHEKYVYKGKFCLQKQFYRIFLIENYYKIILLQEN